MWGGDGGWVCIVEYCVAVRYRLISAALHCQDCHQEYTLGHISLLSIVSASNSQQYIIYFMKDVKMCLLRPSTKCIVIKERKNIDQYELIHFPSKSLVVWALNSIKEKWKTNRTSFPGQTSIRWWTGAGKSVLNKHNGWRNLSSVGPVSSFQWPGRGEVGQSPRTSDIVK